MRKLYLTAIVLCAAFTGIAQEKIDFVGQSALHQYRLNQQTKNTTETLKPVMAGVNAGNETTAVIVDLSEGYDIEDLIAAGAEIKDHRGNMAIVSVPVSQVESFSKINAVKQVTFGKMAYAKLDQARSVTKTDFAHKGLAIEAGYKGAGIIVGAMDEGMDPNHIAFTDSAGVTRLKKLFHFYDTDGNMSEYAPTDSLYKFTYDTNTSAHGTHVMGIMTGGYTGNNYYGVAPCADVVMACGAFSDINILLGIAAIIDYAYEKEQPVVVNLSIGNNIGPHDGTDAFSRYLELFGEDAIICMSAGNEATETIVLNKTFTESDNEIKSFVIENDYVVDYVVGSKGLHAGSIDIWSSTSDALEVVPVICDVTTGQVVFEMPKAALVADGTVRYVSNDRYYEMGDIVDTNFDKMFKGYIGIGSKLNSGELKFSDEIKFPNNNRYNVYVTYYLDRLSIPTNTGQYVFGVKIKGKAGQRVDAYLDGQYSKYNAQNLAGWNGGTDNGTINGMACGKNVIAVGSFNSRNTYTSIGGSMFGTNATVGAISSYSSYGDLIDGRTLPHICAPGSFLLSSVGQHYVTYMVNAGQVAYDDMAKKETVNGKDYYWDAMQGTSMASPFMAGAAALWLEANPYLKNKDIVEIAQSTATVDRNVTSGNPIQWGAGKLNVYNGLKQAINSRTAIDGFIPEADKRIIVKELSENVYEVFVAAEGQLNATLYNAAGQPVKSASAEGDTLTLDADGLAAGVYVLAVQGNDTKYTKRILVK